MKKYIKYIGYAFGIGAGLLVSLFVVSDKSEKVDAGAPVPKPKRYCAGELECTSYDFKYKHCHRWTCGPSADDSADGGYYYEEVKGESK